MVPGQRQKEISELNSIFKLREISDLTYIPKW